MLGSEVAQSTVSKYMARPSKPPSQTWKTFLRNQAEAIAAIDMCVVPTLSFDLLFAFLVLGHHRRQLLWVRGDAASDSRVVGPSNYRGVSLDLGADLPGARQRPCLRTCLHVSVRAMGIRDRPISPGSPWRNGCAERLIGTLRRECLDQMLIFGEGHLRRALSAYAAYYNQARTHLALQKDAPSHRAVQRSGAIVAIPILAGLHHQYVRMRFSERTSSSQSPAAVDGPAVFECWAWR
jgi:hypothetical protein